MDSRMEDDILVDIPDEDLPELAEMYKKHQDWAPHVYSLIKTGMKWRRKNKYMTFVSPNASWKKDGSFMVLMEVLCDDIFVFTLDKTGKTAIEGILNSKRLNYKSPERLLRTFYAVHPDLHPQLIKSLKENGYKISFEIPCQMFSIRREEALKFDVECPSEVYIKPLDASSATLINSVWRHSEKYENPEKYLATFIEMNGGYGVFLKSNHKLVSWVLLAFLGQLAILQTVDGYQRKGYASLITKYMSKKLAEAGYHPFGTVLEENKPSQSMFDKLGFKSLGLCCYFQVKF